MGVIGRRVVPTTAVASAFVAWTLVAWTLVASTLVASTLAAPLPAAGDIVRQDTQEWLTVADQRITESSGLAAGQAPQRLLWTHNDSGDGPILYGLDRSGAVVSTVRIDGVSAVDWEGLASGTGSDGAPSLVVGDIGDNGGVRDVIQIHVVPEPTVTGDQVVTATTYTLRYPNGPRDAETLLVHPDTGQILVVEKSFGRSGVFAVPTDAQPGVLATLRRVGSVSGYFTDGDFLADGRAVLRTYGDALVYDDFDGSAPQPLDLPPARQGETLAAHWDQRSVLAGSEGVGTTIYRVRVPPAEQPLSTPSGADPQQPEEPNPAVEPESATQETASEQGSLRTSVEAAAPWLVVLAVSLTGLAIAIRARRS